MKLVIRSYKAGDASSASCIYAHYVLNSTASFETVPPDAKTLNARLESHLSAGFPVLVAEVGGRLVGYAYASAYRPRKAYQWTIENSVYVADEAVGQGVGRALMSALIADAKAAGYHQMLAVITADHGDAIDNASMAFHRSMGFEQTGRLLKIGYKHDRWLDTVMMQLCLNTECAPIEPLATPPRP